MSGAEIFTKYKFMSEVHVPIREIRQRVPGEGEEVEVHRGPEGAVQVAAAEGRRRAPAQEGDRDSGRKGLCL